MDYAGRRVSALRRVCRKGKVGAVLLTAREHVRYFSGFTGEDSALLVGPRWATLLTDPRFAEQAGAECPKVKIITRRVSMLKAMAAELKLRKVRRLGFEGNDVSFTLHANLAKGLKGVRLKAFSGEIPALREVKDDAELRAVRKAVRAAEGAMKDLTGRGRRAFVGRTEKQLAAELEYRMRLRGAERPAFETIVAVGPHAAMPHHRAGPTRIRRGDFVLIDWGAAVAGYCSDLTRVYFTGRIPAPIGRMYETVLRAQKAGVARVRAGVSCGSVDKAARDVIAAAGHGDDFGHSLGHGVGLEVHESPRVGQKVKQKLRAGMVVTVEPGIYLPGVGGVRIEDDVLVTRGGRRKLTHLPRDLDSATLK